MNDIRTSIRLDEIEITLDDGKVIFSDEEALALLLMNDVIFVNDHWYEKDWPSEAQRTTSLCVNCNDVFAWGCADAENIHVSELASLYAMFKKDPAWGSAIWCMVKRKEMPQKPVEKAIRAMGIWDLDALGLAINTTDAEVTALMAELVKDIKP